MARGCNCSVCSSQELADVESETKNAQKLQHSVMVLSKAKRDLVKAVANIEEVSMGCSVYDRGTSSHTWCSLLPTG